LATRWWKNFEDIFIRFGATHERDGQIDRQTTPGDGNSRAMHSIARQKSSDFHEILYTGADFELDERHVIKNENSCIGQTPSSTERFACF